MEIYGEYDVVVVGGGTSGVAAAIASARAGAKTILIERLGILGGQMNVSGPPGFAYAYMFNPRGEQIIAGIMEETHSRLLKDGHALPHTTPDFRVGYSFALVDPDYWGLLDFRNDDRERRASEIALSRGGRPERGKCRLQESSSKIHRAAGSVGKGDHRLHR